MPGSARTQGSSAAATLPRFQPRSGPMRCFLTLCFVSSYLIERVRFVSAFVVARLLGRRSLGEDFGGVNPTIILRHSSQFGLLAFSLGVLDRFFEWIVGKFISG